jgi:hypothetical protein
MRDQYDVAIVAQRFKAGLKVFDSVQESMFPARVCTVDFAPAKSKPIISDKGSARDLRQRLQETIPHASVISTTGVKQNRDSRSVDYVKVQATPIHIDHDVALSELALRGGLALRGHAKDEREY